MWGIPHLSGKAGASEYYSDLAILTMATLKAVYQLPGRQCEGFLTSIFELMGIELSVPDHSTLSRHVGKLSIALPVIPKAGTRHVVVDSTGVNVYGEGEWDSHYHRRSIAETTMYRLKTIFAGNLRARTFENQAAELFIKCAALNRMIQLAKPESIVIEA